MDIALLGYGKMGKAIREIAEERQHNVVYKTVDKPEFDKVVSADVAIEFSVPEAAFYNISNGLHRGIPVVSGTTGWLDQFEKAKTIALEKKSKFLYASNFSVGVNLFFRLNEALAKLMSTHQQYHVNMTEIHHLQKKDAPSGTAISLAEQIIGAGHYKTWSHPPKKTLQDDIPIKAFREEGVHGTHIITYASEIDQIEIKHEAHTRKGFALGAVLAAEWLVSQKDYGTFNMSDVLNI
jgi:4-hydroxy-tetrahydrodipicolinate reductase